MGSHTTCRKQKQKCVLREEQWLRVAMKWRKKRRKQHLVWLLLLYLPIAYPAKAANESSIAHVYGKTSNPTWQRVRNHYISHHPYVLSFLCPSPMKMKKNENKNKNRKGQGCIKIKKKKSFWWIWFQAGDRQERIQSPKISWYFKIYVYNSMLVH